MALINVISKETLVNGDYKSANFDYAVKYAYSDGKISNMQVTIKKLDGTYYGQANINGTNNNVNVLDASNLKEVADMVGSLYADAVASVAQPENPTETDTSASPDAEPETPTDGETTNESSNN